MIKKDEIEDVTQWIDKITEHPDGEKFLKELAKVIAKGCYDRLEKQLFNK